MVSTGTGKKGDADAGRLKKASKKERAKAKKLQKMLERTAGSDDEDVAASRPAVKVKI